jgi:multisubunit Na+/H+ antiporter MnhB subunit
MSQAKVEKYKENKKNRKKMVRKEKTSRALTAFLGVVIVAAIGVWIGFSVYQNQQKKNAENPEYVEVNMSALQDYESSLYE